MASTPEPLPSIPPSPSPSPSPAPPEDIARVWHDDEPPKKRLSAVQKGKKRAVPKRRGVGSGTDDDDDDEDEDEEEEDENVAKGYPPTKEEIAESRKIEENLRRWEVAERQRRKAARESLASTSGQSTAPSLLADFRSSLFRRDSSRKVPISGSGTHQVLRSDDRDAEPVDLDLDHEALQLEPIQTPTTAAFSAPPTPEPGPEPALHPDLEPELETENPFDTPSASRTSLNIPAHSAIMTESDSVPAFTEGEEGSTDKKKGASPKRPTLLEAPSPTSKARSRTNAKKPPPPPKPIDLPAPRSPPPRTGTPQAGKPPEPVPPPRATPAEREPETVDPGPPVRWWHEWLCGCGEGPDRGGDHQAGRTNPFE
ncbi:hypothetical protein C8Q79DRAFT_1001805 [Trametes meyenii]|nr:hypothetical protein C8Q79DRAFT_1001805 [Trametes meyenii]